jgi:hypothetical protein
MPTSFHNSDGLRFQQSVVISLLIMISEELVAVAKLH